LLKQLCCPNCGAAETLNRHSKLYGNDPADRRGQGRLQRGQRVWCSDRGERGGCGCSFSIFVAEVLPRHTVSGPWLWRVLQELLGGGSTKAACEGLQAPFPLETIYHLVTRLRERLSQIRSRLSCRCQPPASAQSDPLLQTVEHLRASFPKGLCSTADYQLHFQMPLLE